MIEDYKLTSIYKNGIKVFSLSVKSLKKSLLIGMDKGRYKIIDYKRELIFKEDDCKNISEILSSQLKLLYKFLNYEKSKKILIVGLGNSKIIADSLGCKTIELISQKKALISSENIFLFAPDIKEKTGFETFDIVNKLSQMENVQLVIAVDSYSTSNENRIANSIQLSTSGITPGGGVGSNKMKLDSNSLSVPIITIGIPLMSIKKIDEINYITTLSNIDLVTDVLAKIVSFGILKSLTNKNKI